MCVNKLQSVTRSLLVALAMLGLILPAGAMQMCGCCSNNAKQEPHAETCDISGHACCEHDAPEVSTFCCIGESNCGNCGGPECRCNVKPFDAAPPNTPVSAPELTSSSSAANTTLAQTSLSLTSGAYDHADGVMAPYSGADLRLHSQVSVWLN